MTTCCSESRKLGSAWWYQVLKARAQPPPLKLATYTRRFLKPRTVRRDQGLRAEGFVTLVLLNSQAKVSYASSAALLSGWNWHAVRVPGIRPWSCQSYTPPGKPEVTGSAAMVVKRLHLQQPNKKESQYCQSLRSPKLTWGLMEDTIHTIVVFQGALHLSVNFRRAWRFKR